MTAASPSPTQWIGTALTRVIVPLWILTGALFKLVERTPSNLPSQIVKAAKDLNLDLGLVLRSLIGLEFFAVAVMLFMPRFARSIAIFILACFCGILLNEIRAGATSCGCFGKLPISPWLMLAIDGTLLLAVALFDPRHAASGGAWIGKADAVQRNWSIAAVVAIILGFGIAFGVPEKPTIEQGAKPRAADGASKSEEPPKSATAPVDPTRNPNPLPLKPWYSPEPDRWMNKPWREIDLFQFMPRWPAGLDKGRHYVLFYSKTCDHCHLLLQNFFEGAPPISTVLIEIPPAKPGEGPPLPMPTTKAQFLALPKADWVITTPLMLAIEDGKVVCAKEGADPDFPECLMEWMQ